MSLFQRMFSPTPASAFGLDLGSATLKAAQVAKASDGFRIVKSAVRATPASAIKEGGRIHDPKQIAEEVRELVAAGGVSSKRVVSAVSGPHVVIRTITMPKMTEKELHNSIKYEAERYIPYSVAEAQVAGSILRNPIPGDEANMEVLLMASPKEIVLGVEEVIRLAGLDADAIELEPIALLRLARLVLPEDVLKQTVALINVGASSTSISIMKEGTLRNSRTISVAGNGLTRAISQAMNTGFEEAETLKKEKGEVRVEADTTPVPPATMRIFNIMLPVLTELATEIQRSFDFYRSRYRGESVDVVYLSGGTSQLKNLDRYIAGELGVHVELLNPIPGNAKGGVGGFSQEETEKMLPIIPVSLGLAARQLG